MKFYKDDMEIDTDLGKVRYFLYKQLNYNSRKVFLRVKEGQDVYHDYRPRRDLVKRLARDNNMSEGDVVARLNWERRSLLKSIGKCREE